MSNTNATPSPRDDEVDANPDLARKKQRLSEDQYNTDSPGEGSVLIEACEPEDIGASLDTAIQIEDDSDDATMLLYSADFPVTAKEDALACFDRLHTEVSSGKYYLQASDFHRVAKWLEGHVERTRDDTSEEWQRQYLEWDSEFFSKLGWLLDCLLATPDLFEPAEVAGQQLKLAVASFFQNAAELSCRILALLPDVINATLARRDSAMEKSAVAQPVGLFSYIAVALKSVPTRSELPRSVARLKIDMPAIQDRIVALLSTRKVTEAVGTVVKLLSGAMRQIKDSWLMLQDLLAIFLLVINERRFEQPPDSVFEGILAVLTACIMPAIGAKHPGALPPDFHSRSIEFVKSFLYCYALEHTSNESLQIYLRFIRSDEDALIAEGVHEDYIPTALARVSDQDSGVLGQLFAASWAMQAALAFIRSDIMNVRMIGLHVLENQLRFAYNCAGNDMDNVFVRHAVRFLRTNEVAKYIFSSDSHASLVAESSAIVSFLSETETYTDQETDVIWRACTTSVEADFVKAAFGVLRMQLAFLDFGHVLYVLRKYADTPADALGVAAIDLLPEVIKRLEEFHGPTFDSQLRVMHAFAVVDILQHIEGFPSTENSHKIRQVLHRAVGHFAGHNVSTMDRKEVYARILPGIGQPTPAGNSAVQVITILLQNGLPAEDTAAILSTFPVQAAVDDLQLFISSASDSADSLAINYIVLRLSFILRLMSIDIDPPDEGMIKTLFDLLFGERALGRAARANAWDKLRSLTLARSAPSAALDFQSTCMERYVPSLPTELADSKVVELVWVHLREKCATDALMADYSLLLQQDLWQTLVRFAIFSSHNDVTDYATTVITHFLLDYPAHPNTPNVCEGAIKCQKAFVIDLVQQLEVEASRLAPNPSAMDQRGAMQIINLLHSVMLRSRNFGGVFVPASQHDLVVLDSQANGTERLSFNMQIYHADRQAETLSVQATKSTTVSQLLASLPARTGAASSRIIASGREITGLTTQSLEQAGVHNSGVIQIRPRYKQDFNFDHLLMSAGPVEKEIVAHFDSLEKLIDGPNLVAERAVAFLGIVPPPGKVRDRFVSSSASVADLFPRDRPSRARYSILVLTQHLRDCARVGLAEPEFLIRAIRLLTSTLMDATRDLQDPITPQLLECLHSFLQGKIESRPHFGRSKVTALAERADDKEPHAYFDDGAAFVSKIMEYLSELQQKAETNTATVATIAWNAYGALLLASQIDRAVWDFLVANDNLATLHRGLLIHRSLNFSSGIARLMRSLCQDPETPTSVVDELWPALMACLPAALNAPFESAAFFNLAPDVLQVAGRVKTDEAAAHDLVDYLTSALWGYEHAESVNYLVRDDAIMGLLTLLRDAVMILKSFKKPLQFNKLSSRIAEMLLFADGKDTSGRPLIHQDTRTVAYDLMRATTESAADFWRIVSATEGSMNRAPAQLHVRFPASAKWRRETMQCCGLENLGMTCYMNSMLQQLFGNVQLRKFLLDVPLDYPEKQPILCEVQNLFARMQSDLDPAQNPQDLARALGVQVGNQEDVHDFFASLLSRLEDEMPDADSRAALANFFTGHSITQIRGECGHVSSQKEAFGDLSVTVKNKPNLHESLAEFVQGEPMEGANKYKCMSCDPENGRLVDAMRRTCLEDVPDCLTVCLKRFTFEGKFLGDGKVNDRFDFPETIDMSLYQRAHLEAPEVAHKPDIFQLAGVIVHQGSLNLGHYWSYVRVPDQLRPDHGNWYYLEDTKTLHCPEGFQTIQQECFGGQRYTNGNERADNAYVLCYQRTQYVSEAALACEGAGSFSNLPKGLPAVPLSPMQAESIQSSNAWRQQIAALFDPRFANHVCWLLNQFPAFMKGDSGSMNSESEQSKVDCPEGRYLDADEVKLGCLIAHYILRILLSDPYSLDKLSQTTSAVKTVLDHRPRLASPILDIFASDDFAFAATLLADHSIIRDTIFEMLRVCVEIARDIDRQWCTQMVEGLLTTHSNLIPAFVDKNPQVWTPYLAFATFIAKLGPQEACMVLDLPYIQWIIDITMMHHREVPNLKRSHLPLWNKMQQDWRVDYDPLFGFLADIFGDHVDVASITHAAGENEPRTRTARGWTLSASHRRAFMWQFVRGNRRLLGFFMLAYPRCITTQHWRDYGLGRLFGLLVSERADFDLKHAILSTLSYWCSDNEEMDLGVLLLTTLHVCANADVLECEPILRQLSQELLTWGKRRQNLAFFREAYTLTPVAALASADIWTVPYLCEKPTNARQDTASWLSETIFAGPVLPEEHGLDANRARLARSLGTNLMSLIRDAYHQEHPRNGWDPAMEVLEAATAYLSKLVDAVARMQAEEEEAMPTELMVECDEARGLIPSLMATFQELDGWETTEVALPTRGVSVRQSVEIDESEENVSEADEDEFLDDADDFGQGL